MRKLLSRNGARWAIGLIFTMLAAAQSIGFFSSTLIDRIDLFAYGMRLRVVKPVLDPRIVIVNIDEKSLNEVGRWPWSRNIDAKLVRQLVDHYHVKAVGFDVIFTEPDTSSGYATLEALTKREFKDIPRVGERLHTLKPMLDYDGLFAKALQGRPIVLGYFLTNQIQKGLLPAPVFTVQDLEGRRLDAPVIKGYDGNLAQLQQAARAGGFINATDIDSDGVLRSTPLLVQVGNGYYESLALSTARIALGATKVMPVFLHDAVVSDQALRDYGVLDSIRLNDTPHQTRVPVERYLNMLVEYRGAGGPDGGAFRYISAVDVLNGTVPLEQLAQCVVLVGTTASGLNDLRATPVNPEYPGVEVHANIIKSILDGSVKQKPDFVTGFDLMQVVLIGIMLTLALSSLTPVWSILFATATAAATVAFNFWMYHSQDMVLPVAMALLLILGLFIFNIAWGYLFEFRKGRAVANLFSEYVAPELVAEMVENPASYSMEGESRVLTVLFADVRGFTTISEGLEPNVLREYINLYLTAMSENIRGNRGTLDKYIGDAVMAFWGAPVALPDHASRAVATALLMQASARTLNEDFIARGWPPLKIGIGLNTGDMRVGDMGSKIRRAYTVMGDAVNLSSRLEGITKEYGVGVVVGEATKLAAPEFAYRELDRVKVKGKNEPVPIFEPVALESSLDDRARNLLAQWHQALGMVRAQSWDQAEQLIKTLQQENPEAALYSLYLERIAYYRTHPPGADWDGVTTFVTK